MLVSAQTLLRQGLEQAMQVAGVPLLAALSPQAQVMRHLTMLRPDVVIVDLDDPTGEVRRLWPDVAALPGLWTLTLSASSGSWSSASHMGAGVTLPELLDRVVRLYRGEQVCAAEAPAHPSEAAPLLIQDRELLLLLGQGLCNRDIASTLHLSEKTIRNRLSKTFARLHVTNRTQAAICALRLGLV
ncbi:LuxR C-terminal-related transcriptional regulator [Deinococcus xinjiangensis]|uniref:LuxR C-terminal-related transcriptional regulator n=1 Tax=Deinococcus xinjiangensis TaxID=457454 RepID=UPI003365926A